MTRRHPVYTAAAGLMGLLGGLLGRALLVLIWLTLLTPAGLAARLVGRDPLTRRRRPPGQSYWRDVPPDDHRSRGPG